MTHVAPRTLIERRKLERPIAGFVAVRRNGESPFERGGVAGEQCTERRQETFELRHSPEREAAHVLPLSLDAHRVATDRGRFAVRARHSAIEAARRRDR